MVTRNTVIPKYPIYINILASAVQIKKNEKRIRENTHDISVLWSMIVRKDSCGIEKYLKENFEKNIGYAKKYGIPVNLSVLL